MHGKKLKDSNLKAVIEASPPAGALKKHETSVHADFQALYRENETKLNEKNNKQTRKTVEQRL